jgi:TonB family protein
MKTLIRLTYAAIAFSLCALPTNAQATTPHAQATTANAQASDAWVVVSPRGENFSARMPKRPVSLRQRVRADELSVEGLRYAAAVDDQTTYIIWSLKDPYNVGRRLSAEPYVSEHFQGEALYLDQIAEVAWELLITPELERLRREKTTDKISLEMSYKREFELSGRPAREYSLYLEKESGPVYICADGSQVYVVVALSPDSQTAQARRFVESFTLKASPAQGSEARLPSPVTLQVDPALIKADPRDIPSGEANSKASPPLSHGSGQGGGIGSGEGVGPGRGGGIGSGSGSGGNTGGGNTGSGNTGSGNTGGGDSVALGIKPPIVDYSKPFKQSDLTRKALITFKPEPGYTESARKFNVTGVVRLRAILAATGEVNSISVVKGLPHGLTSKALAAAKQVKFQPARKDGRIVSQYVVFEYNFNIY